MALVVAGAVICTFEAAPAPAGAANAVSVVGQGGNFTTASSTVLGKPGGVSIDPVRHRMFVANRDYHRVTIFNLNADNSLPDEIPDYQLGDGTNGTSASRFSYPTDVVVDSAKNRLFVTDAANNRVMVFELAALASNMNASYVIGEDSFTVVGGGVTATRMQYVSGLSFDTQAGYLYVTNDRRVSIFDTNVIATGMAASYVLGQSSFTGTTGGGGTSGMTNPQGVAVDSVARRAYVSDFWLQRVLVFDITTPSTGMDAINVLGQSNFSTTTSGTSSSKFSSPGRIVAAGGYVYVSDEVNNRVLGFSTGSISNGMAATKVFGQPNFGIGTSGRSVSALDTPRGLAVDVTGSRLYVSDFNNNRLMVFNPNVGATDAVVSLAVLPIMTFTVAPRVNQCGLQAAPGGVFRYTASASATSIDLGRIDANSVGQGAHDLSVGTNANSGAKVYLRGSQASNNLRSAAAPTAFTDGGVPTVGAANFSFTVDDPASTPGSWKALSLADVQVGSSTSLGVSGQCVGFSVSAAATTPAGNYTAVVFYTAVPIF